MMSVRTLLIGSLLVWLGKKRGKGLFRALQQHLRIGGDAFGNPVVSANRRTSANCRLATQNGRVGVNDHVVFDRRVALCVSVTVPRIRRERNGAERDTLVYSDALADLGGFANHDTRPVVDKEAASNTSPGMDVDTRPAVRVLRHHPRDQR